MCGIRGNVETKKQVDCEDLRERLCRGYNFSEAQKEITVHREEIYPIDR